ncbi:TPA: hypothetical protein MW242_001891 [Acinetobacter baumannii]|nr:hypothetical protein [Acinetobacter baumannii]
MVENQISEYDEEILQDSVKAVFDCGSSFSEAKFISQTDEFNPQQTLQTQRTNFRHIYENKLPNEIGRTLGFAPEYSETSRQLITSHYKEIALENLIEEQDFNNRYVQENDNENDDLEFDEENSTERKNEHENSYPAPRPPGPGMF